MATETLFQENVSKVTHKKLTENINYLERENDDLRDRIYDLESSLQIHKNLVNHLSEDKHFDPQARYYTEQLNQESELLHSKVEKLTKEKSELRGQLMIQSQIGLKDYDYASEETGVLVDEIKELKENLDRKEYLLQYCEQRNTEMEKLLKKRAANDDYIKKRLDALAIEPDKERTITNVVEDLSNLREQVNNLKKENKSLREQLDYAQSNGGNNINEMTIFANNIKPTPQLEELNQIKVQSKSKDLYMKKLEEMVKSYIGKIEKFKDELTSSKSEINILKDRVEYFDGLNEKLKKAVVKYKTKCEELDEKINDQGVKVWVKENTGVMRVKPASQVISKTEDEDENDSDEDALNDINVNLEDKPKENSKESEGEGQERRDPKNDEERVIDEFAPEYGKYYKQPPIS